MIERLYVDETVDHLLAAIREANGKRQQRSGFQAALDIAARVQRPRDPRGPEAETFLRNVLGVLEQNASTNAAAGYGRFRWLWYLRRVSDDLFAEGKTLGTTGYDRMLAEALATKESPVVTSASPKDDQVAFPIDSSVARRIIRLIGYTKAVSEFHGLVRWCGKGSRLIFHGSEIPTEEVNVDIRRAVEAYDARSSEFGCWDALGTFPDFEQGYCPGGPTALFVLRTRDQTTVRVRDDESRLSAGQAVVHYTLRLPNLEHVSSLMSHPAVADLWSPEVPDLLLLLAGGGPLLARVGLRNRLRLMRYGYMVVRTDQLLEFIGRNAEPVQAVLAQFGAVAGNAESLLDHLTAMTPRPWPLLPGCVALPLAEGLIAIDFASATDRLIRRLEYPRCQGAIANVRAEAFEQSMQRGIDGTSWRPPDALRPLIRRKLRRHGRDIGDIDALAHRNGRSLLISCKSMPYTDEYDMGQHATVRNIVQRIEQAVEESETFVSRLRRESRGDNYDMTPLGDIYGVVTTPRVMYAGPAVTGRSTLPRLRTYCGAAELLSWLRGTG